MQSVKTFQSDSELNLENEINEFIKRVTKIINISYAVNLVGFTNYYYALVLYEK
jgi:hypothetical protein